MCMYVLIIVTKLNTGCFADYFFLSIAVHTPHAEYYVPFVGCARLPQNGSDCYCKI